MQYILCDYIFIEVEPMDVEESPIALSSIYTTIVPAIDRTADDLRRMLVHTKHTYTIYLLLYLIIYYIMLTMTYTLTYTIIH